MQDRWSEKEAAEFVARYGSLWGADLALAAYCGRLLDFEKELAVRGEASLSVKGTQTNILGEAVPAILTMTSGCDPAAGHATLDLLYLRRLRGLAELPDSEMLNEFRTHLFDFRAPTPPPETLAHAFLPMKFILYTHAQAVLALANQPDGSRIAREALGDGVLVLPYCRPWLELARATAEAYEELSGARAVVWPHHGLLTWGETACAAYSATIDLVTRAEEYLDGQARRPAAVRVATPQQVEDRIERVAPIVRGLLARSMRAPGDVLSRVIVRPLRDPGILDLLASARGKDLALSPPLVCDQVVLTKPFPLWVDAPDYDDPEKLRGQLSAAMEAFARDYEAYRSRHSSGQDGRFDTAPRIVLLPGLGALCAGADVAQSAAVRYAAGATLAAKARMPGYQALPEADLFRMETGLLARAKFESATPAPLAGRIAMVTGAAGAIGAGICEGLLRQGCAVALADLPGERLTALADEFRARYGELAMPLPFDVAEPAEVAAAFGKVILAWGGLDLAVVNAGIALVSSLADMQLEAFRRLERVNIEGTLNILSACARHFRCQDSGGDVVLISTKNVFAPGAKFGAYSATKAAAHQLARIASLEFAPMGVRVNMVAPDAVFRHGTRRSGLWEEVGADRARSVGLSADQLEAYYRNRSLLKAEVTATHVANAVVYFATHQSPTTGATLPVDGGLPDATPR